MPPVPLVAARRDHLVVCGEDALACRVIEELTTRYGQPVTVLLRSQSEGYGPRIAALPRVRVIEPGSTPPRRSPCLARTTWATSMPRCGHRSSTRSCGWW